MIPPTKTKKNILITGASGQLGSEFKDQADAFSGFNFIFQDKLGLDISDEKAVTEFFEQHHIDVCVNCAAYTAVDKAEAERSTAEKINIAAPGYRQRQAH